MDKNQSAASGASASTNPPAEPTTTSPADAKNDIPADAKSDTSSDAKHDTPSDAKDDTSADIAVVDETQPTEIPKILTEVAEKIAASQNVLIALSSDPSVDEFSAAIGLSLFLDRLGKRATAIYSGTTPNVLEFLNPDEIFEPSADTLQDFVIALNKNKADHLRYKLDGDFVKIFITPYKTKIAQEDLTFSYGDFNVDLVLALDVANGIDLDSALREYGRIMHDAVIINITTGNPGKLGEIEWSDKTASSVSEMVSRLLFTVVKEAMEKEEATAFLTGIVAATNRFSNAKTTPSTMHIAGKLMKSGANQQLVSKNITPDVDNELVNMIKNGEAPQQQIALSAVEQAQSELASADTAAPSSDTSETPAQSETTAETKPETPSAPESDPAATSEAPVETPAETSAETPAAAALAAAAAATAAAAAAPAADAIETAPIPEKSTPDDDKLEIEHPTPQADAESDNKISLTTSEPLRAPVPDAVPELADAAKPTESTEPTEPTEPAESAEPASEKTPETATADPESPAPNPEPSPKTPSETPAETPAETTVQPETATEAPADDPALLDDLKAAEKSLSEAGIDTTPDEASGAALSITTDNAAPDSSPKEADATTPDASPKEPDVSATDSSPKETDAAASASASSSEETSSGLLSSDQAPEPGAEGLTKTSPEKIIQPPSDVDASGNEPGDYGKMLENALSSAGLSNPTPVAAITSPAETAAPVETVNVATGGTPAAPAVPLGTVTAAPTAPVTPGINGVPQTNTAIPAGAELLPPPPAPPVDLGTSPMSAPPAETTIPAIPTPVAATMPTPTPAAPVVAGPQPASPDAFKIPGM